MSACLLTRIAAGEPGAVDEFLTRYGGLVWTLTRRQIPNQAEAEEAVQEIFIDLWRHAARFDERVASEVTYVAMITRRRLIDFRRKQQRTVPTISIPIELDRASSDGQELLQFSDDVKFARKQLALLRPIERQIIELAIDQGLSHSQIAETLGMPLGTVKTTARRGLIRLRELFHQDSPKTSVDGADDERGTSK